MNIRKALKPSPNCRSLKPKMVFHPFSLGTLLYEHDLLAVGADGDALLLPPQHGFYDFLGGQTLADSES